MSQATSVRLGPRRSFGQSRRFRVAAFVGVAGLHVALVVLLSVPMKLRLVSRDVRSTESLAIFLVPSTAEALPPVTPLNVPARTERQRARPVDTAQLRGDAEPAVSGSESESDSSAITIDWAREAERAAARFAEADEDSGREVMGFPRRAEESRRQSEFGWSHSRTHRIERTEDGATVLWLNDHCVLVYFLVPACQIGKIEANGDLFEHMDDPPVMGDWKDP